MFFFYSSFVMCSSCGKVVLNYLQEVRDGLPSVPKDHVVSAHQLSERSALRRHDA